MLYVIGLGLNERGISKEGLLTLEKCKKVYLEGYTVEFPYAETDLKFSKKRIIRLRREDVESNKLLKEAKSINIALLVYGSPLFATTHLSLLLDAKRENVWTKVIYSASVFDGLAETGLQLYKFGKISSMPTWTETYKPDFLKYVVENQKIKAHSVVLADIGLSFRKALYELNENAEQNKLKLDKVVACSRLGTEKQQIVYGTLEELKEKNLKAPFCFVIPSEMHFLEEEALENFKLS
jgi:diphthine methyl ester synthase